MNADKLLQHYELVADAPDAITRLRRFVFELAVRGKLLPQSTADARSAQLLGLVGGLNDQEALVPRNWVRSAVGVLLDFKYGKGLASNDRGSSGPIPVFGSNGIVGYTSAPLTERSSIIIGRKGSAGALNICEGPSWTTDVAYYVEPPPYFDLRYLYLALSCLGLDALGKGVKPGLSRNDAYKVDLWVPPLSEQRRIVAKVDELMALCDRLEASRAEREAARDRLTAASLACLNAPEAKSVVHHARFALNVLPALTARPDQIKQLRRTILNLAVRGLLVAQNPADKPAAELLKRIAAEKLARKQATGDARIKAEPDPDPVDLPMALPWGWGVQSFQNLFLFIDYRGKTPPKTTQGIPLITAKNVRMGSLNREPREFISSATFKAWMTRGVPAVGDLFFTTEAPLANVCLNDIAEPFALAQRVICLQPYGEINTRFLMIAMMSDVMQSLIDAHATGLTAKGIKAAKLKPLPIPIPPLREQQRIAAKVDELMALCDQLEGSLSAEVEHRSRLLETMIHEALSPGPAADEPAVMAEEVASGQIRPAGMEVQAA